MKAKLTSLILLSLLSCREKTSDDQITKTKVKDQIQRMQEQKAYSDEEIIEELKKKNPAFKEKLANVVFESLSQETITKLMDKPQVQAIIQEKMKEKEVIQQVISSLDESDLTTLLEEPQVKVIIENTFSQTASENNVKAKELTARGKKIFDSLQITVERKVGIEPLLKKGPSDPYLKYQVQTKTKNTSCEKVNRIEPYWAELVLTTQEPKKMLGLGPDFFENLIKSCLIFHRLKASMEYCRADHLADLKKICLLK